MRLQQHFSGWRRWAFSLTLVGMGAAITACDRNFTDPSAGKAGENDRQIQQYLIANKLQTAAVKTTSGLYYVLLTPDPADTARTPQVGDQVEFKYRLSLLNDQVLDTATTRLPFGSRLMLTGLEEGLGLMAEGRRAILLLPASLAYDRGNTDLGVPEYEPVRIDVQLIRSRSENQQIQEYITAQKLAVSDTASGGIRRVRPAPGAGAVIAGGQTVRVGFTGRLFTGLRPFVTDTLSIRIGRNDYLPGFDQGLAGLRVNEKATLLIPSALAYGTQGTRDGNTQFYQIPPYTPLRYDVQILSVQ
ncbi:FKBP-type peptidyl-prolyl cis-trans isomerase [Larkinella soli]|uniref:FKBP-type peptidyl-prolyl cis-trans isomerase n=1 Tax=Larkinella soli TaxID=1770527 RepID=UPI0013E3A16C|nr:FKBP-type peptidyl-prolyl cis-trans isomerase [Larkinella soli]